MPFRHALALQQHGKLQEAAKLYQQILDRDSRHYGALHGLGVIRAIEQKFDEALRLFRKALNQNPNSAEALNSVGYALRLLDRLEEALPRFERALAIKPDYAEAHVNLGNALKNLGRIDAARDAMEKAVKLFPRRAMFHYLLAQLKRYAADDAHVAAMESLVQDTASLSAEDRGTLHFALGKACADVGNYDTSFHHLFKANGLKRGQIVYDEAKTLGLLARVGAVFDAELLRAKSGLGDPSSVPVFVVGMARSGTTLVEQILASHPKVFGAGERRDFEAAVTRLSGPAGRPATFPEQVAALSGDQFRRLGAGYVAGIRADAPKAMRITDKMPSNYCFVGLIHLALPNARIIHTRRDPVDVCLSNFSLLFDGDRLPHSYDLAELGRYYRAYEALMEHWRRVLPEAVMLDVQYEELVADVEAQARRIVAYCGLEWDDACLAFHENQRPVRTSSNSQVRRPIYRSAIGRPRPSTELLRPLLDALGIG